MQIEEVLQGIKAPDKIAYQHSEDHWNRLAKPLGSLGELEIIVSKFAAIAGNEDVHVDRRTLLVMCADNGVIRHGVSQSDETVTTAVAKALGVGCSTVNNLAKNLQVTVRPINIGMKDTVALPGVENRAISLGTADMTEGPAMSYEACVQAIRIGVELAMEEKKKGTQLLLLGEMGIGNTTTSCAVGCVLLDKESKDMAGRGAGLSDDGLMRKIRAIEKAIEVNQPDKKDPIDVLAKVGGYDLAGLCGICIGAAYMGLPIILDGLITDVAALCACRLNPIIGDYLFASHQSSEPLAQLLLKELNLKPLITAGIHLGEGAGAVLSVPLIDQVLEVYHSQHTFAHLGIDAYEKL